MVQGRHGQLFVGATGLVSGIPSPSIGQGWGLWEAEEDNSDDEPEVEPDTGEVTEEDLRALQARFNRRS